MFGFKSTVQGELSLSIFFVRTDEVLLREGPKEPGAGVRFRGGHILDKELRHDGGSCSQKWK